MIAHGSRRAESNDEVRQRASAMGEEMGTIFDRMSCCFLELAVPSIPDAIDRLVAEGAAVITVFPYFLSAGMHVTADIPAKIEAAKARHPDVTFNILPHLGAMKGMHTLILGGIKNSS